jgi:uncharacterized protein YjbI with pentapeptide repeats
MERVAGRSVRPAGRKRQRDTEPAPPDLPADLVTATGADAELGDGVVHAGLAVDDLDLSGREATEAELDQCRYRNVNLGQVRFHRSTIKDAEFINCDLANVRARESSIRRVVMRATRMTGLTWITGTIRDVTFDACRIDLGYFSATRFSNVVFAGCRLAQANFGDTDLADVRFDNCDLTGAQFSGASLADTTFSGCDLTGLSGVTSLRGATIALSDAVALAPVFAEALGIKILPADSGLDALDDRRRGHGAASAH